MKITIHSPNEAIASRYEYGELEKIDVFSQFVEMVDGVEIYHSEDMGDIENSLSRREVGESALMLAGQDPDSLHVFALETEDTSLVKNLTFSSRVKTALMTNSFAPLSQFWSPEHNMLMKGLGYAYRYQGTAIVAVKTSELDRANTFVHELSHAIGQKRSDDGLNYEAHCTDVGCVMHYESSKAKLFCDPCYDATSKYHSMGEAIVRLNLSHNILDPVRFGDNAFRYFINNPNDLSLIGMENLVDHVLSNEELSVQLSEVR